MPHDPKIVGAEFIDGGAGRQVAVITTHEAPAELIDGSPMVYDQYAEADIACCKEIGVILNRHFPGYLPWWKIEADARNWGGVKIGMPVFLGPNIVWFIRGTELNERAIKIAGGSILEMLKLRRDRARMHELLEVRAINGPRQANKLFKANS